MENLTLNDLTKILQSPEKINISTKKSTFRKILASLLLLSSDFIFLFISLSVSLLLRDISLDKSYIFSEYISFLPLVIIGLSVASYFVKEMPQLVWGGLLVSSITMILAVKTAKSKNNKKTMLFLIITLLLGIAFTISQFSAWNKLIDNGYRLTEKIFHPDTEEYLMNGEYGKDFTIEFQGNPLIQENDGFYFWGEQAIKIDKEEYTELKNENPEMAFGKEFIRVQETTKKKKTVYEAVLYSKMKLSPNYLSKLKDMSNVSSSYFYVLTAVHLLHILVTLLYLINMIVLTSRKELTEDNQLKIKLGGYFWHFFAGLWVYLLLFLFLIH